MGYGGRVEEAEAWRENIYPGRAQPLPVKSRGWPEAQSRRALLLQTTKRERKAKPPGDAHGDATALHSKGFPCSHPSRRHGAGHYARQSQARQPAETDTAAGHAEGPRTPSSLPVSRADNRRILSRAAAGEGNVPQRAEAPSPSGEGQPRNCKVSSWRNSLQKQLDKS